MDRTIFPPLDLGRGVFLLLLPVMLSFGPAPVHAADRLVVESPRVVPADADSREGIEALIQKASVLANRSYGQWFEVSTSGDGAGAYRVSVVAVLKDNPAVALTLRPPEEGRQERSFALLGPPGPETVHYFARVLFLLWASCQEQLRQPSGAAPQLVDELPVGSVADSLLPNMGAALMPFSAVVTGEGSLILGLSLFALELDRSFRVVGGRGLSLYDQGVIGFAQSLAVTPGGTLYLKPAMAGELYRFGPRTEQPQRIRLPGSPYGPLVALPDGSVALLNTLDRKLMRIAEQRVREIPLGANPDAWPTAMAAGPEGTLWIYYPAERRIKIHAPTGEHLDSVLPLMDYGRPIEATALAVYPDGRFVMHGRQGLWCFERSGLPLWRLEELPSLVPGSSPEPLPQQASLAFDPAGGILYLTELMGRRVIKLLDIQYCNDLGIQPGQELRILTLNRRQQESPRDAAPTAEKALLYEAAGALEMAGVQWERALQIDPRHRQAQDRLRETRRTLDRTAARAARDKALRTLEAVGRETARRHYQEAMQLYEAFGTRYPDDLFAGGEMAELRERFESGTVPLGAGEGEQALAIVGIEAENLFPALIEQYHRRPVLRLELRNILDRTVRNLQAAVRVERFMDFPSQSQVVSSLGPGARVTLEIKIPLNAQALELEESLPVQGQVEITYRVGAAERRLRSSVSFTIYRRTALRWDDSGRLSSFITPNDGIVSAFALGVIRADQRPPYRLSEQLLRAIRICDALGAFGLRYVQDPDSPISRVLDSKEAVDTVRFPRLTLQVRSGDCDDTTALLASLLEAVGIRTAVVTSPGHVFLAFDCGESPATAWLLEANDRTVVVQRDTVWVPVETTLLAEGFLAAWREASSLYRRHHPRGEIELLPVGELRERYPPIPLPPSSLPVVEPTAREIAALNEPTLRELERTVYHERLRTLEAELASGRGKAAARIANRIGILHAVFRQDEAAEGSFRSLLGQYPDYQPATLNLANLKISRGELGAAEEILQQALRRDRESPALNLLLAQLYHHREDRRGVREHFRIVELRAPELAARFSYLADGGQSAAGRAGVFEASAPFWE